MIDKDIYVCIHVCLYRKIYCTKKLTNKEIFLKLLFFYLRNNIFQLKNNNKKKNLNVNFLCIFSEFPQIYFQTNVVMKFEI